MQERWVTPHPQAPCIVWQLRLTLNQAGLFQSDQSSTTTMQTQTAIAPVVTAFVRRIWAPAIIAFGLGLTVGWISIIGYALVSTMIELVS